MKSIKMMKIKTIIILTISFLFIGCSDYLDVDKDTDNPTVAPLNYLLTATQVDMSDIGDYNNNAGSIYSVYVHQMCDRGSADQYGARVDDIPIGNDWAAIYANLRDLNSLISQGTASGDMVYVGIAQLQKAYIMSVAVDLWGDVPFSQAGVVGLFSPKFDNQKLIYSQIFDLIDIGKTNIDSNLGSKKPSTDDIIYAGNRAKWLRFANTFKLKLYNQTRLTSDFDQAGFDALIASGGFFANRADDFQINKTKAISPTNERNRLYIESYESTQFGSYISPWFYEILKGVNPSIHSGFADPRRNYLIYNQLKPNQFPPDQGDVASGNPKADYWDKSTGFFSIRFGSNGPYRDSSAEKSYSYPGVYACGGKYNDGLGGVVNQNSGLLGVAPRRILTYDEFLFIQAELIQSGKLTSAGTASAKLDQAIKANLAKIDEVVTLGIAGSGSTQVIPKLTGSTAPATVAAFLANIISEFNAASPAKQLEIIMTQKWIATFGDPIDQYTDYRRTGYPILANPNSTTPEYQLNNGDSFPLNDSQTNLTGSYQQSLFWPQSELNGNENAPSQKQATTYKIFWAN